MRSWKLLALAGLQLVLPVVSLNMCGTSYTDAAVCARLCPSGTDADCATGETCFADVQCACDADLRMSVNWGYYASWASERDCETLHPADIDASSYTHLSFSFLAVTEEYELALASPTDGAILEEFVELKTTNPKLKAMASVGGWEFNSGATANIFTDMVATAQNRAIFVTSAVALLTEYGLDGLDLDWEYPGDPERGGKPADKANLALLVQELRAAFDANGKLLLTMAMPLAAYNLDFYDLPALSAEVDFFNVMTYDLHEGQAAGAAGVRPHTNMPDIEAGMQLYVDAGVPGHKLVFGLGAYARTFTLESSKCTKPGCKFKALGAAGACTKEAGYIGYFEIAQLVKTGAAKQTFDAASGSMYAVYNGNQWAGYDNPDTFCIKLAYAQKQCLRGTMVWAIESASMPEIIDSNGRCSAKDDSKSGSSSSVCSSSQSVLLLAAAAVAAVAQAVL